jgi:hypothetical protein
VEGVGLQKCPIFHNIKPPSFHHNLAFHTSFATIIPQFVLMVNYYSSLIFLMNKDAFYLYVLSMMVKIVVRILMKYFFVVAITTLMKQPSRLAY